MSCNCRCHPAIDVNCWCPSCMENHINFENIMKQMESCEYCGDGIPKSRMDEHLEWCKPMIIKRRKSNEC